MNGLEEWKEVRKEGRKWTFQGCWVHEGWMMLVGRGAEYLEPSKLK